MLSFTDWPTVNAVILTEFGGLANVSLCITTGTDVGAHSCQGRCNETKANVDSKCRCDPECLNYGDCCYDYEIFPTCNDSPSSVNQSSIFTNDASQNSSWSNYLGLIKTLDNVISSEQMDLVLDRNTKPPGYDCINPSLTPLDNYYLVSR